MNTTFAGPRRPRARSVGEVVLVAALAVVAVAVVLVSVRMTRQPSVAPALTVANPTVYQVEVDVSRPERANWLSLGSVRRESEQAMHEVIDQGPQWAFRFRYGGREAGRLVVSRAELAGAGWRLTIPPEVGRRLQEAGVRPSAR